MKTYRPLMSTLAFVALSLSLSFSLSATLAYAETRVFDVEAVEINKTKYWLPSQVSQKKGAEFSLAKGVEFTVQKGDTVIFHPVSKIEGANNIHGFAIDEFKVEALADAQGLVKSKDKEIKFVANQTGSFKIRCHLHPAHVGGQLIVVDKH